jgi:transcriptional regulator with XRE-family HTH domain
MKLLPDRAELAKKVRDLRVARQWTQSELAHRLGLSQNRLSEIERGAGSFTAEQFLAILQLFNVTTNHFEPAQPAADASVQNALARLGATQLIEEAGLLPSERLRDAQNVVLEVLVAPDSPRWVTALAPVLVQNADTLQLSKISRSLAELGLAHRLGWVVDNTLGAIAEDYQDASRARQRTYRRAEVVLRPFLEHANAARRTEEARVLDVLDRDIRSPRSLARAHDEASMLARRWGIASALTPTDFVEALRGARAAD